MLSYLKRLYLENAFSNLTKIAANEVEKFKKEGTLPELSALDKYISSKFFFKEKLKSLSNSEKSRLFRYQQLYIDVEHLFLFINGLNKNPYEFEKIFIKIISNIDGYPNDTNLVSDQLKIFLGKHSLNEQVFQSSLVNLKSLLLQSNEFKGFYYALNK